MSDLVYSETQVQAYLFWCSQTDRKATMEDFQDFVKEMEDCLPSPITPEEIPSFVKC